ncbi:hypothetical protein H4R18_003997, partial [Coemansia javaensis]
LSKYTHVSIVAGAVNPDGSLAIDASLAAATTNVKASGPKVLVSIGGASGPASLSAVLTDTTAQSKLISSLVALVSSSGADGVDVDWRRPGQRLGVCGNGEASNPANLLALLTEVRAQFEQQFGIGKKLVTATVGAEALDASAFTRVIDYVHLQPSGAAGPGAPPSLTATIDAWTAAGWPADQLTAGVAFFGRASTAPTDAAASQRQVHMGLAVQGDRDDVYAVDPCTGALVPSGQWQWRNLRAQGVLVTPIKAAAPWVQRRDDTTQTPWLFNPATRTAISYEDPQSIRAKVAHAAARGLAGASIRSAEMDHNGELLAAVRAWSGNTALGRTQWRRASSCEEDTVTCKDEGKSSDYTVCRNGKPKDGSCKNGKMCYQDVNCHTCKDPPEGTDPEAECIEGEGQCDSPFISYKAKTCKDGYMQRDNCKSSQVCYLKSGVRQCMDADPSSTGCPPNISKGNGACVKVGELPDYNVCDSTTNEMVPGKCPKGQVCLLNGASYKCGAKSTQSAGECTENTGECEMQNIKTGYWQCLGGKRVDQQCKGGQVCKMNGDTPTCVNIPSCTDASGFCNKPGKSSRYVVCKGGVWTEDRCSSGTCYAKGDSYSCNKEDKPTSDTCTDGEGKCDDEYAKPGFMICKNQKKQQDSDVCYTVGDSYTNKKWVPANCDKDHLCFDDNGSGKCMIPKCTDGTTWCAEGLNAYNKCVGGAVVTTDCDSGLKCVTDSNKVSTCK